MIERNEGKKEMERNNKIKDEKYNEIPTSYDVDRLFR